MFKKILCPVDLQPRSKMALRRAINIAHQFNSKIYILNIHEEFRTKEQMVMSRISVNKLGAEFKKIAISAKKDLKDLIHELEADDINCEYILRDGNPSDVIIHLVQKYNIDLILMGTNGRNSISDYLIGSTTQKVIERATCPVLVMPKGNTIE